MRLVLPSLLALLITAVSAGSPTLAAGYTSTTAVAPAMVVAPPWVGLPVRTYANLKKRILGDPVNIAFEGAPSSIIAAFDKIGWLLADPLSLRDDALLADAAMSHRSYPTAPVSNLYLFGRREDFAVERELGTVAHRDHARFWDAMRRDAKTGLELYIGDASRDIAIKILRSKRGIPIGTTHRIDGDLDAERDNIVTLMRSAGVVAAVVMEPGMGRTTDAVNGGGDHFHTDGQCAVIVLK